MADSHDLGELVHVSAEAIGTPGRRRFRLCAMNGRHETASLWMEKEQLDALGDALETVLDDQGYAYERPPLDDQDPGFPEDSTIEMRVGRLSLGLDPDAGTIVLFATDGQDDVTTDVRVDVAFSLRRAYELRGQIKDAVEAGRPPCPLCTGPMDPDGHVCVKTNGHHPH